MYICAGVLGCSFEPESWTVISWCYLTNKQSPSGISLSLCPSVKSCGLAPHAPPAPSRPSDHRFGPCFWRFPNSMTKACLQSSLRRQHLRNKEKATVQRISFVHKSFFSFQRVTKPNLRTIHQNPSRGAWAITDIGSANPLTFC